MFPPFEPELALREVMRIAEELENQTLKLERVTQPSAERQNQGVMLGALVCTDKDGKIITLRAVSGISFCLTKNNGAPFATNTIIVPPVVDAKQIEEALSKNDAEIHTITERLVFDTLDDAEKYALKKRRTNLTTESLMRVHSLYTFACIDKTKRSLYDICGRKNFPPTGTGDCATIKLLNYAFLHNLHPISLAECFYSAESGLVPQNVPPCDERCALLLPSMLGLNILYRDSDIVVVNKPSGLLSIPGRGEEKKDSVTFRLRQLFANCIEQPSVHRLDMETSGIMVLALTKEAHRNLSKQFALGEVYKEYTALVDDVLPKKGIAEHGTMELYFRLDVDNRPHQIWDTVYGKKAITEWKILGVERYASRQNTKDTTRYATRVLFIPHTGRTHQLRLACANEHGFGSPIIGDSLYGNAQFGERLMLHAHRLCFIHPSTGKEMEFFSAAPF